MSTTATSAELWARIEALVQEHIAASHKAAMAAVQRAFLSAPAPAAPTRRQLARTTPKYRSRDTLAALQEAIYQSLKSQPGIGAAELSAKLGVESKDLSSPMAKFKKAGLVKSVGLRSAARYFPVAQAPG